MIEHGTNTTDIPPALTPNEWRNVRSHPLERVKFVELAERIGRSHAAIALENDALNDEDVRKLTPERVALIRWAAERVNAELAARVSSLTVDAARELADRYSDLVELADALESYLPPAT